MSLFVTIHATLILTHSSKSKSLHDNHTPFNQTHSSIQTVYKCDIHLDLSSALSLIPQTADSTPQISRFTSPVFSPSLFLYSITLKYPLSCSMFILITSRNSIRLQSTLITQSRSTPVMHQSASSKSQKRQTAHYKHSYLLSFHFSRSHNHSKSIWSVSSKYMSTTLSYHLKHGNANTLHSYRSPNTI